MFQGFEWSNELQHVLSIESATLDDSPKTGSNRAQNAAKYLGVFWILLGFLYMFSGSCGFKLFKMAILGSRMDCNILLVFIGTSKKSAKYGAPNPLFITKILLKNNKEVEAVYQQILLCKHGILK